MRPRRRRTAQLRRSKCAVTPPVSPSASRTIRSTASAVSVGSAPGLRAPRRGRGRPPGRQRRPAASPGCAWVLTHLASRVAPAARCTDGGLDRPRRDHTGSRIGAPEPPQSIRSLPAWTDPPRSGPQEQDSTVKRARIVGGALEAVPTKPASSPSTESSRPPSTEVACHCLTVTWRETPIEYFAQQVLFARYSSAEGLLAIAEWVTEQ